MQNPFLLGLAASGESLAGTSSSTFQLGMCRERKEWESERERERRKKSFKSGIVMLQFPLSGLIIGAQKCEPQEVNEPLRLALISPGHTFPLSMKPLFFTASPSL